MFGTFHAWFVVEVTSMTHDFSRKGTSLSFFGKSSETFQTERAMHR